MSLLFREHVRIVLCPDRILLRRTQHHLRKRILAQEAIAVSPVPDAPLWMAAVSHLKEILAKPEWQQTQATVILSNHFVRYVCVPGNKDLNQPEEKLAYARYCFAHIYGDSVDRWTVRLSPGKPPSAGLASAVDTVLLEALMECLSSAQVHPLSIQPYLMLAFNRFRKRIKAPAWLVLIEPGKVCMASLGPSGWQSVRTRNLGTDWQAEMPLLLERESQAMIDTEDPQTVFLYAGNAAELPAIAQKHIHSLQAGVHADGASSSDYELALVS